LPKLPFDPSRLCVAVRRSREVLRKFREERRNAIQSFVGLHYSDDGAKNPVYLNVLAQYVRIVGRNLISKSPRVMYSTFSHPHKPAVEIMERWANREIERMKVATTLARVATDGLFSIGILKVGIASPMEAVRFSWQLKAGSAYMEAVDLDDFAVDPHCRDFSQATFIGHRLRCPLDVARKMPGFKPRQRKNLVADRDQPYNHQGDAKASTIGRGELAGDDEEFIDHVTLWEFYLPQFGLLVTFHDDDITGPSMEAGGGDVEPLEVKKYVGPPNGPYHILGFQVVPSNPMPKGPIMDLVDLHEALNRTMRKAVRQTDRMKEVTAIQANSTEDGNRIVKANDGEMVNVVNPQAVSKIISGGALPQIDGMAVRLEQAFDKQAGNLALLGGLAAQSKTATQDKMLNENSSAGVVDLQETMTQFVAEALKSVAWLWWHDPFKKMRALYHAPANPDVSTMLELHPRLQAGEKPDGKIRREADWDDLDVKVDPYSLRHQTPEQRSAKLMQLVQQLVLPMAQLLQAQGIQIDMNKLLEKVARYEDMPDLGEILALRQPPADPAASEGDGAPKPATTTRNYVRESMPGRTQKGNDMNMASQLMGMDPGGSTARNGAL
jgi:hypothetical protein